MNTTTRPADMEALIQVTKYDESDFVYKYTPNFQNAGQARAFYRSCRAAAYRLSQIERFSQRQANPQYQALTKLGHMAKAEDGTVGGFEDWFPPRSDRFADAGSVASLFSPAAYLAELYAVARTLHQKESSYHIDVRRPDLKRLVVSQAAMDTAMTSLSLSNTILEAAIRGNEADVEYQPFAALRFPFTTPFHRPLETIKTSAAKSGASLADVARHVGRDLSFAARASLTEGFNPEFVQLLTESAESANANPDFLEKNFGLQTMDEWVRVENLMQNCGLSESEIKHIIGEDFYRKTKFVSKIKKDGPVSRNEFPAQYLHGALPKANASLTAYSAIRRNFNNNLEFNRITSNQKKDETVKFMISPSETDGNCRIIIWSGKKIDGITDTNKVYAEIWLYLRNVSENIVSSKNIIISYEEFIDREFSFEISTVAGTSISYVQALLSFRESGIGSVLADFNTTFTIQTASTAFPIAAAMRFSKLVRLSKTAGLPSEKIDWFLQSCAPDDLTPSTVHALGVWPLHRERYDVDFDTFVASLSQLNPYFSGSEKSQFERVFNDASSESEALYFIGDVFRFDQEGATISGALCKALDLTPYELELACRLTDPAGFAGDAVERKLTPELASHLFRMTQLARSHGLSFVELYGLLNIAEKDGAEARLNHTVDPAGWLDNYDHVWSIMSWMKEDGLSTTQLLKYSLWAPVTPATPDHFNFVQQLHLALQSRATTEAMFGLMAAPVAAAFGLTLPQAKPMLTWIDCEDVNLEAFGQAIDHWFAEGGSAETYRSLPTEIIATCNLIAQIAGLVRQYELAPRELELFETDGVLIFGTQSEYFDRRPFDVLRAISGFKNWIDRSTLSGSDTLEYFSMTDPDAAVECLAKILGCDLSTLTAACTAADIGAQFGENGRFAGTLPDVPVILKIERWIREATKLNVDVKILDMTLSELALIPDAPGSQAQWNHWLQCEKGFVHSDVAIQKAMDEKKSAVLSDYYLHNRIRAAGSLSSIKTRDDLYGYILLDTQVTSAVETSQIAEAIAGLQLYIDRCLQEIEPGVQQEALAVPFLEDWVTYNRRYATWAGLQKLLFYPENYVKPELRYNRTRLQAQLERDIQQGRIGDGTVTDAYLRYLNDFENIANLETISGFQTDLTPAESDFYFVGRTRSAPRRYFWRKLDTTVRDADGSLLPTAWSEWLEIKVPGLEEQTLYDPALDPDRTDDWPHFGEVQIMHYNNRLYIVFTTVQEKKTDNNVAITDYFTKIAYLRFDGSWAVVKNFDITSLGKDKKYKNSPGPFFMSYVPYSNSISILYYNLTGNPVLAYHLILNEYIEIDRDQSKETATSRPSPSTGRIKISRPIAEYMMKEFRYDLVHVDSKITCPIDGDFGKAKVKIVGAGLAAHVEAASTYYFKYRRNKNPYNSDYRIIKVKMFDKNGVEIDDQTPKDVKAIKYTGATPVPGTQDLFEWVYEATSPIVPTISLQKAHIHQILVGHEIHIFGGIESYYTRMETTISLSGGLGVSSDTYIANEKAGVQYLEAEGGGLGKIRLNTLFGLELVKRANRTLTDLLSWDTQNLALEPPMENAGDLLPMDFSGAYGIYFWELFFYTPFLVASRFIEEQRYDEAEKWLRFIFDPYSLENGHGETRRYWNVVPLEEDVEWSDIVLDTTDPDEIALADPLHYKVNTYFRMLDLLIERGDTCFRQLERDTLVEAKLWYLRAKQLLGERPYVSKVAGWGDPSLGSLVSNDTFADFSPERSREALKKVALKFGTDERHRKAIAQPLRAVTEPFRPPFNDKLDEYWEKVDSRLYNLRHNLSIDGKALTLPLYAEPVDPAMLHASVAAQLANATPNAGHSSLACYRFTTMLNYAHAAVSQLTQFGATLQSILDRQDAESLAGLQAGQGAQIATQVVVVQESTVKSLEKSIEVLRETRNTAEQRRAFYSKQYDDHISENEQASLDLRNEAITLVKWTGGLQTAGGAIDLAPNVFGLANGGMHFGAPFYAAASATQAIATGHDSHAMIGDISEGYRRRRDEWQIQRDQAKQNISELDLQIEAAQIQLEAGRRQLRQATMEQANSKAVQQYLRSKFTNEQLYHWMKGQLASVYYQYYDYTVHICRLAQEAYRFEVPSDREVLPFSAWNDAYQGLLAGEILARDLSRLERKYLDWTQREIQVSRTVSLSQVYSGLPAHSFDLQTGVAALLENPSTGPFGSDDDRLEISDDVLKAQIKISNLEITSDYPAVLALGDLRPIKQISVTLPALVGPYQDIKAVLRYSGNGTLARGCDAIAISRGINDSGQFQLDFNDASYLPFEGIPIDDSGTLTLSFPNATGKQKALLGSLSDMILHIRYTIRPST